MAESPRRPREHVKFSPRSPSRGQGVPPAAGATAPGRQPTPAPRSASGKPAKPRIRLTQPAESASFGRGLLLVILLAAALVAAGLHAAGRRPDPHFATATKILKDYEQGRDEDARNYSSTVYDRALSELDQVDPESVSFGEAHALRTDLERRREAFFVKIRKSEQGLKQRESQVEEKRAAFAAKQAHSRMHPKVEYPECDE